MDKRRRGFTGEKIGTIALDPTTNDLKITPMDKLTEEIIEIVKTETGGTPFNHKKESYAIGMRCAHGIVAHYAPLLQSQAKEIEELKRTNELLLAEKELDWQEVINLRASITDLNKEYFTKEQELSDLQNRFEALTENYGDAKNELERVTGLLKKSVWDKSYNIHYANTQMSEYSKECADKSLMDFCTKNNLTAPCNIGG